MLTLDLFKSVRNWWSNTSHQKPHPLSDDDNDEDLDEILATYSDQPPQDALDLFESRPIESENLGYKCQERMGFVSSITSTTGVIDGQFVFNLDDIIDSELKVGSKVSYLAYRLGENEDWRVKNIVTCHEENWDCEPDWTDAADPISGDVDGVGDVAEPCGGGEILGESAAFEKNVVCQVLRREGRIVVVDYNDLRVDLNTTSATFIPFAGDWVALDTFVQVREDAADLSGDVLEIVNIRPLRVRKLECVVTKWDPQSRSGTVDNNIFFRREFCSPGYMPVRGDKVVVKAIESSSGNFKWRALSVKPKRKDGEPLNDEDGVCHELDDPNLYEDKNGIFVTKKLDFGTIDVDVRRVIEFVIENGSSKQVRVKSIEIRNSRSRQITLTQMPALPRDINGGTLMRLNVSCLGRHPGFHMEVVVIEFEGFKIARRIFCEVKPAMVAALQASNKHDKYLRPTNRQDLLRSQRLYLEKESKALPGVPLFHRPRFIPLVLPSYAIPKYIWDLLECPNCEISQRILEAAPMFREELSPGNYVKRFQFLLYLAEVDEILDLRRYDMNRVKFVPKGEYLALMVPGLAESRPSLITGDRVEAFSVIFGGNSFEGYIHKISQNEVFLKFDPMFHARYLGEDYSVKFIQGRSNWRKLHHGIHKVSQNLGAQWLFPTGVAEKPPQVVFEEVEKEETPPAVQSSSPEKPEAAKPGLVPSSSDNEKHLSIASSSGESRIYDRNESNSSDEGCIRKTPEKPKPLTRLLSLIKEEKDGQRNRKDGSNSETSSLASDVDWSGSRGSDSDSGPRETPKKSLRDNLRQALQIYSNGGNAQNTSNNQGSPSSSPPSQNIPATAQDRFTNGQNSPSNAQNSPANVQNSPVNGQRGNINRGYLKKMCEEKSREKVEGVAPKKRLLRWLNTALNCRQKDAVRSILRGEARPLPYVIFGPPGTGKTMTLVESILQIYMLVPDSRILIATPSNSAADLIMERLLDWKILRPGDMVRAIAYSRFNGDQVPPRLLPYCALVDISSGGTSVALRNVPSVSRNSIGRHRITVSTCMTSAKMMSMDLPRDHFTHVIIDEAGQATEPEAMIALGFLSRNKGQAVLAGDPMQLGPSLLSVTAGQFGLSTSFLSRLLKRIPYTRDTEGFPDTGGYDPRLVTKLIYNYRCVPSILKVISDMFYDSELIPMIDGKTSTEAKILSLLVSQLEQPMPDFGIVFEGVKGTNLQEVDCASWCNYEEAYAVLQYVSVLTKHMQPEDIGIITPYRKQVIKLRQVLESYDVPIPKIGTVEEFQGQERLVIIVSTVRSNRKILRWDQRYLLGFVSSPRRLNVAISRAKSLLIVVGDPHLLSSDPCWRNLLRYCIENGSYIGCDLPSCLRQIE